jgi:hypothetical protein
VGEGRIDEAETMDGVGESRVLGKGIWWFTIDQHQTRVEAPGMPMTLTASSRRMVICHRLGVDPGVGVSSEESRVVVPALGRGGGKRVAHDGVFGQYQSRESQLGSG